MQTWALDALQTAIDAQPQDVAALRDALQTVTLDTETFQERQDVVAAVTNARCLMQVSKVYEMVQMT